jgi:hypothetical protein
MRWTKGRDEAGQVEGRCRPRRGIRYAKRRDEVDQLRNEG